MPARCAPSRNVVSNRWKSSPSGVPAGLVRVTGVSCQGSWWPGKGLWTNKKPPAWAREVCMPGAEEALSGTLENNDHLVSHVTDGRTPGPGRPLHGPNLPHAET